MKLMKGILAFLVGCLHLFPVPGVSGDEVSVSAMEGDSVILHTGVNTNKEDRMTWYFNNIRIAYVNGEKNKICTDDRCPQRFRDRLKLTDSSLTIININTSDAGVYKVEITSRNIAKSFSVTVRGASAVDPDRASVSVMEGDTVTLHTGVEMNQRDRMIWIFGEDRLAIINGDKHELCEDVECKERFRDRLKLDHVTGSLTIMNITITDSGLYNLKNTTLNTDNIFSVNVHGVSAAEQDEMKRKSVKEGESVTLDTRVIKKPTDVMRWYFNDSLIAEMTGDQSKICTDDQCKESYRDRLEVNQTGSLIITNTRTTDSGEYTLQINSSRFSIMRSFTLTVSVVPDSGSSSVVVAVVVVLLLLLVAAVVFYKHQSIMQFIRRQRRRQERREQREDAQAPEQIQTLMQRSSTGTSRETEAAGETEAADETEAAGET